MISRSIFPLLALATLVLSACPDNKGESAWPDKQTPTKKVETTSQEERVDLYGDRLPAGSVARLGSVRMFDRRLGRAIFSGDGSEIITSSEESYLVWQTTTAQRLGTLDIEAAAPAMAMRGDGKVLATAMYGGAIQLWDYAERRRGAVLTGHTKVATALCFAGDTLVSASEDRTVRIWAKEGVKEISGDWEKVTDVHCRDSGIIFFADDQGAVFLSDLKGTSPVSFSFGKKKKSAKIAVNAVTMGSDSGPFVAALGDGTIAIWSAVKVKPLRFDAHAQRVLSVAFTPDGRLMSSGADAMFRFWDAKTGEKLEERSAASNVEAQRFELSGDGGFVVGFSELKDGRASESGRYWLYDGKTGKPLLEPDRHKEAITAVAFSKDGKRVVSASEDGKVYAWNVADASLVGTVSTQKGAIRALSVDTSEKGGGPGESERWFSVGDDARMHVGTIGGTDSIILEPLGGAVHALAVDPLGRRLIIGDFAGKVTSFSRSAGTQLARHDSDSFSTIHALAFSPDGKTFVIAGGNRHIHVISAASGKKITMLSPEGVVANYAVAFSPDGKMLATGGDDHVVRLWNTRIWKEKAELEGHDGTIRAVAFSADSTRLASGASDEVTRVWDVYKRTEITLFAGHRGVVTSLAFSPDGKLLASGSRDRTALIWELPEAPAAKPADPAAPPADPASKPTEPPAEPADPPAKPADPAPAKSDAAP